MSPAMKYNSPHKSGVTNAYPVLFVLAQTLATRPQGFQTCGGVFAPPRIYLPDLPFYGLRDWCLPVQEQIVSLGL